MKNRFLVLTNLLIFLVITSCSNIFVTNKTTLSFSLGEQALSDINKAASSGSQIKDNSVFNLKFTFDGLDRKPEEKTVEYSQLGESVFVFEKIPFDREFKILVDISFNDIIIYQGVSNSVTLTEASDGCNVNISINLKPGKIVYESNGGSIKGSSLGNNYIKEYYITSNITAEKLPYAEKSGYSFGGWYFDEQCTKPVVSLGKDYFVGNVKLFAKWNINHYTISYETGTEKTIAPITVEYGYKLTEKDIPVLTKNESDYLGWYFGTEKIEPGYVVDSDITLTCRWQGWGTVSEVMFSKSNCAVDYGETIELSSLTEGSTIYYTIDGSEPSALSLNYTTTGPIIVNDSFISGVNIIKAIAVKSGMYDSKVTSANYTIKTYTVKYENGGYGTAPIQQSVKNCDSITLPKALTADKMHFLGWNLKGTLYKAGEQVTVDPSMAVGNEITITAKWEGVVESVTFNPPAGEIDFGDTIALSSETSGATIYYTLDGSEPSVSGLNYSTTGSITVNDGFISGGNVVKAIAVKEGMQTSKVAFANYTIKTYTVKFDKNGHGTAPADKTGLKNGDAVPKPTDLSEAGYTFGGWYKEKSCQNAWDFATEKVTGGKILYAKWTLKQVTNVSYEILADGINLTWTNPASSTLSKVVISSTDSTFTPIELTESKYLSTSAQVTYKVTTADSSKQSYVFNIKVVDFSNLESSPAGITAYYPVITSFTIPNWKKTGTIPTSYTVNITGEHLSNANLNCFSLNSTDVTFQDNKKITITSDTEMAFSIVPPQNVKDGYKVSLSYCGNNKDALFNVKDYGIGDIAMSDGTFVAPENYVTPGSGTVPVAVIFREKSSGSPALGVGLKESNKLNWANDKSMMDTTLFNEIVCTPDKMDDYSKDTVTFTGDDDGSDNWNAIVTEYGKANPPKDENAAYNDSPAFSYVRDYATEAGLSGTNYKTNWYMPSIIELCELCRSIDVVNPALEKISGVKFTNTYWSSSQTSTAAGTAWVLEFNQGGQSNVTPNYWKSGGYNILVRCIRKFE